MTKRSHNKPKWPLALKGSGSETYPLKVKVAPLMSPNKTSMWGILMPTTPVIAKTAVRRIIFFQWMSEPKMPRLTTKGQCMKHCYEVHTLSHNTTAGSREGSQDSRVLTTSADNKAERQLPERSLNLIVHRWEHHIRLFSFEENMDGWIMSSQAPEDHLSASK